MLRGSSVRDMFLMNAPRKGANGASHRPPEMLSLAVNMDKAGYGAFMNAIVDSEGVQKHLRKIALARIGTGTGPAPTVLAVSGHLVSRQLVGFACIACVPQCRCQGNCFCQCNKSCTWIGVRPSESPWGNRLCR